MRICEIDDENKTIAVLGDNYYKITKIGKLHSKIEETLYYKNINNYKIFITELKEVKQQLNNIFGEEGVLKDKHLNALIKHTDILISRLEENDN